MLKFPKRGKKILDQSNIHFTNRMLRIMRNAENEAQMTKSKVLKTIRMVTNVQRCIFMKGTFNYIAIDDNGEIAGFAAFDIYKKKKYI
jgi:hypothetical protein